MKNSKITIFIFSLCTILIGSTKAQELDSITYNAYLSNSLEQWERAVNDCSEALSSDPENRNLKFELAMTQYGLLNATMASKNEEVFDEYLDRTKSNLEQLIDADKKWAEPRAVLSAIYGLQMGYSPWKGMFLGSKSSGLMDKAIKLNDQSATVMKLYAGSKLFTPEMFGGDVQLAVKSYEKAIELYESDQSQGISNWLYLDALAFLGIGYEKLEDYENAVQTYKKALSIEPEFNWVKMNLLPRVESKIN